MKVRSFAPSDYFGCTTYVVESNDEWLIIDPSVPPKTVLDLFPEFSPVFILLTHAHFDHMLFLSEYKKHFPDATVLVGREDAVGLSDSFYNASSVFGMDPVIYRGDYTTLSNGDSIDFGCDKIHFYRFEGHTKGSIVATLEKSLFVGDLIFDRGGYGRTDLYGGDSRAIEGSIRRLFAEFSNDCTVYPGHGSAFSLENAAKYFEYLFRKDV